MHHVPIYNKNSKILKKMWVFYLHCILMLRSSVLRTVQGPLDLYNPYGLIPELFDFSVHNAYQMHLESTFLLHLNHIPINNMISIRYIFIEKWYMEYIMNRHRCKQWNHIIYWTNPLSDFKWPTIQSCQLWTISQLQGTYVGLHFQEYMVYHFKFPVSSALISIDFLSVLGSL